MFTQTGVGTSPELVVPRGLEAGSRKGGKLPESLTAIPFRAYLAKTSLYITNQRNMRRFVSHPLANIFAPWITRRFDSLCTFLRSFVSHGGLPSRGSAKLLEQALNLLAQGVRIFSVLLPEIPFELDMDEKF